MTLIGEETSLESDRGCFWELRRGASHRGQDENFLADVFDFGVSRETTRAVLNGCPLRSRTVRLGIHPKCALCAQYNIGGSWSAREGAQIFPVSPQKECSKLSAPAK